MKSSMRGFYTKNLTDPKIIFLLNPIFITNLILGTQFIVWLFFMPNRSQIPGVADKFWSYRSVLKFILFYGLFVGGMLFGEDTVRLFKHRTHHLKRKYNLKFYREIAFVAALLFIVGEIIYARIIIENLYIMNLSFKNSFATLGDYVHNNTITGLSSLNNIFLVPVAIWSFFAFSRKIPVSISRKYKIYLILLGIIIILHGLFLAARMFIIYYFLIVFGAFLISHNFSSSRKIIKYLLLLFIAIVILVVAGEYLRSGILYSSTTGRPLLCLDTFKYVTDRLLQAYISSDFNNAMVILSSHPSMQLVSTAKFFRTIAKFAGVHFWSYGSLPLYTSLFGTVNIFGLWWFDWGWFTISISFMIGFWIGILYKMMIKNFGTLSFENLIFLITYPSLFSLSRINYFGLSIYIIPFSYLMIFWAISKILVP